MPKQYLGQVTEDLEVGGKTISYLIGDVVRATPKTGGDTFIRLQFTDGNTYLWSGDIETFDFATANLDPETEPQWKAE